MKKLALGILMAAAATAGTAAPAEANSPYATAKCLAGEGVKLVVGTANDPTNVDPYYIHVNC